MTTVDKLLKEFLPTLKPLALMRTACPHDADDLLQDVAIKVLKHRETIGEMPFAEQKLYTRRILTNAFLDMKRMDVKRKFKTKNIEQVYADSVRNPNAVCVPFTKPEVEGKMDLDDLIEGMESVHEHHRIAIAMSAAGYNTIEISKRFGVGLNTALGFVFYGRKAAIKISEGLALPKTKHGASYS